MKDLAAPGGSCDCARAPDTVAGAEVLFACAGLTALLRLLRCALLALLGPAGAAVSSSLLLPAWAGASADTSVDVPPVHTIRLALLSLQSIILYRQDMVSSAAL